MAGKLYYEARIAFGFASVLPLLGLPVYALIDVLNRHGGLANPGMPTNFELLVPLVTGLSAAHLMSIEREERFDELRQTFSEAAWQVPVARIWGALVGLAISLFVTFLILTLHYPVVRIIEAFLPAVAPALYLMGLAFLSNNVSGNYWLSASLIGLYWFLEYASRGQLTRHFYLFNHTFPIEFVSYQINRLTLFVLATLLLTLNVVYSAWRRRAHVGR